MKMNLQHLCSMNRNITGKLDGTCFWNVSKDVKNTAAGGEDRSKKVMTVPPYYQKLAILCHHLKLLMNLSIWTANF